MYGYVVPDKSTLSANDFVLYRSFYCGLCCETGRQFGQLPRFTTNYDFTLLIALLSDYSAADVVIEEHGCVLNPKRKPIVQHSTLLEKLAAANIILCYFKAKDGVEDGDGLKYRIVRSRLKKPAAAARKLVPEVWDAVERYMAEQKKTEKACVCGVDRAADPFASLLRELPELILGVKTDDNIKALCYNIGKFVYLVDALDDIAEDGRSKRYNPFLAAFGAPDSAKRLRTEFISAHRQELELIFNGICGRVEYCFYSMRCTQCHSLLRNILTEGLKSKVKQLLDSTKKLKAPRL